MPRVTRQSSLILGLLLILLAAQSVVAAHVHADDDHTQHQCELCNGSANLVAAVQHTQLNSEILFLSLPVSAAHEQARPGRLLFAFRQRAPPITLL